MKNMYDVNICFADRPDGAAILRREEIVLNVLKFDLYIPTGMLCSIFLTIK